MAGSPRHASGNRSLAVCDRCGLWMRYVDLQTEPDTRQRVHAHCLDDPSTRRGRRRADAIALRDPRPDDIQEDIP